MACFPFYVVCLSEFPPNPYLPFFSAVCSNTYVVKFLPLCNLVQCKVKLLLP
jgi:hypothetical protein